MQETQVPTAAEPKSESESVSQDPQLLEQLKNLPGVFFSEGNRLSLDEKAADQLPAIARLCSKTVTRIIIHSDGRYRDCHFEQLQQFPNLRELTVLARGLTDASFLYISNLQSLTKLEIGHVLEDAPFTERGLRQLTRLRNARLIKLPKGWPTGLIGPREKAAVRSKVTAMLQQALPDTVIEW